MGTINHPPGRGHPFARRPRFTREPLAGQQWLAREFAD